ncbi:MAG: phosphoribosylglycinamide formyltransferase [Cyclobacteriaceae bacterium]
MNRKYRLAIFASGSGTNAERFFEHFKDHQQIEVALLLSNNPKAFVLERAKKAAVPARVFDKRQLKEGEVLNWLREDGITHIVLAGFLWLIPDNLLHAYPEQIINIHPALLPKYGGKGMYGSKVHEAVKEAGEMETGITIHLVNHHYDEGAILFQAKTIVNQKDTPDEIASKVHKLEYAHYPVVTEKWILGEQP